MNHHTTNLLSLQSLLVPLNEELEYLHSHWHTWSKNNHWDDAKDRYHALANVLSVANLPAFTRLANLLKDAIDQLSGNPVLAPKVLAASRLLQHELFAAAVGVQDRPLVETKAAYLQSLLDPNQGDVAQGGAGLAFFGQSLPAIELSQADVVEPSVGAWRSTVQSLLATNQNDPKALTTLAQFAKSFAQDTQDPAKKQLWEVASVWLESLGSNTIPSPHVYAHILSELDRLAFAEPLDAVWLDNLLLDIYVSLASLEQVDDAAKPLLIQSGFALSEQDFFARLLQALEGVIFSFGDGNLPTVALQGIKQQLSLHGWSFYAAYVEQILADAQSCDTPELLAQMQWQITTQLQDLYGAMQSKHEAILAGADKANSDNMRQVRILVEDIKNAFNAYLHSKDLNDLPKPQALDSLKAGFDEMAMDELTSFHGKLVELFSQLSAQAPSKLSWAFADACADGLSLFELFLDGLAKGVYNESLLSEASVKINQASHLMTQEGEAVDFAPLPSDVLRYDDSGEVAPSNAANLVEASTAEESLVAQTPNAESVDADSIDFVDDTFIDEVVNLSDDDGFLVDLSDQHTDETLVDDLQGDDTNIDDIDIDDVDIVIDDSMLIDDDLDDGATDTTVDEYVLEDEDGSDEDKVELPQNLDVQDTDFQDIDTQDSDVQDIDDSNDTTQTAVADSSASESEALSEAYLAAQSALKPDEFDFDEDIQEIFVEEAQEVLEELSDLIPQFLLRPDDLSPLKDIRRGFHTLKGSGRMVGAFSIGEMAWAVENMLNRVLDGTLTSSHTLANFVQETAQILPTLVEDFAQKQPPSLDPARIVLKANNLLAGLAPNEGLPVGVSGAIQPAAADKPQTTDLPQADTVFGDETDFDDIVFDDGDDDDLIAQNNDVLEADVVEDESIAATANVENVEAESIESFDAINDLPAVLVPFYEAALSPVAAQVEAVDDDIKEIYIEEAQEVLETITPLFEQWRFETSNKERLTDIRRGFHTLKGSGRMVGAVELGELGWAVENMLNRVLDGTIAVNQSMTNLLSQVLSDFPDFVQIFEQGGEYPAKLALYAAVAHAYSKGHGEDFAYPLSSAHATPTTSQPVLQADIEVEQAQETGDEDEFGLIQKVKAVIDNAAPSAASDEEEDELCQIFIEEAEELLLKVKAFLAQHTADNAPVSDEVVRAFHTLRGARGLAPLAPVGEVGAMIETGLQTLQRTDKPMSAKHLKALSASVSLIESYLNAYKDKQDGAMLEHEHGQIQELMSEEQTSAVELSELLVGIDDLLDGELTLETIANSPSDEVAAYAKKILADIEVLEGKTLAFPKFQRLLLSLSSGYQVLLQHPSQATDDALIDALMNAHHALTELFDALAGSMSLKVDEHVLSALDNKVVDIQSFYKAHDDKTQSEQPKPQQAATSAVEFVAVETDPELLEIFLEEASELDTAIGEAFASWRANPNDVESLKVLQRHLHTVKGGARLAGIASIGDLTHEAETVYEKLGDGRIAVSEGWLAVMQSVQDILSLQIEEVRQNKRSFVAHDALRQLQEFLAAGEVPSAAMLTLPVLESGESTVEEVAVPPTEQLSDFARRQLQSWHGELPDTDILSVFLEETEELVESSAEDFGVFRSNTGDIAILQSLQRKLHTIKGGARMVGANGLADLAHHMETVYEDLASRRRPATRMVVQLLMSCHDWMTGAMVLLKAVLNPPTPTPLIEALEMFSRRPDSLVEVPVVSLMGEMDAIAAHEAQEKMRRGGHDISRMPPSAGLFETSEESTSSNEMIRISANLMERMVNLSGEAAINRARIDMSMASLTASIEEMGVTVQRLHDQLRRMDIELEAQILAQIDDKTLMDNGDFDPLEMDQYSSLNQLSKSLSESASDLLDLKATLLEKTRDGENLLLQLSRTHTELQDGLMYSRMVPFSRLTPRLQRIVRQVSSELGKSVELSVVNADDEMDRTILERITSPLEHMLRNAIDHGVEMPDEREAKGKPKTGRVVLEVVREGGEILIHLTDDGAGINVEAVRKKAIAQGLIAADDTSLSDVDIMQYIFNAGLSTTSVVTQISGRGVGMDVVRSEIQQLGGSVSVDSVRGQGSRFTMRVPLTVAVSDTLVVRSADRQYAIPLVQIERVTQLPVSELVNYYRSNVATVQIDGEPYRLRYLNEILAGHEFDEVMTNHSLLPVILIKNQAGQNLALQVDEIVGSRIEVVIKPLGRQLAHVSGISAATIMGDGSVMFILDLMALMRAAKARVVVKAKRKEANKRPVILVVDDSVTVRKVTSRFLERQGFEAVVAKDGLDALEILQELTPDLMLLDIEMPRMDGFEVATQVRHNPRLAGLPIIMITSRTGEKHRERAFEVGVSDYMGKPFQENDLLNRITAHLTV